MKYAGWRWFNATTPVVIFQERTLVWQDIVLRKSEPVSIQSFWMETG
jgi:hypothetical protein